MKSFSELMETSKKSKHAVFSYHRANLGDHIQTLGLLQHVTPREFLLRDGPMSHNDLCLLANGWMTHGDIPKKENFLDIKYVGIHLSNSKRTPETLSSLKECGVIGCRDSSTYRYLLNQGVKANFCGCASLSFPTYTGPREGIVGASLDENMKEWTKKVYPDIIFTKQEIPGYSLDEATDDLVLQQFKQAYDLLMIYQKAELVITPMLHVSLPCLAFGTPVIYVGGLPQNWRRLPFVKDYWTPQWERMTAFDGIPIKKVSWRQVKWFKRWVLGKPSPVNVDREKRRYMEFLRSAGIVE